MPGIFGACKPSTDRGLNDLRDEMTAAMNRGGELKCDSFCDESRKVVMGRVSLGVLNTADQPLKAEEEEVYILFHGELYNNREGICDPQYILNAYLRDGDDCALELTGIYHFLIYDKRLGRIKLFSDKFGLYPLYYWHDHGQIVFGAEVKALLADKDIRREPDYRGLADFFHFKQILGEKTLFENIQLLPAGSVLTYDMVSGGILRRQYWDLADLFVERGQGYCPDVCEEVVSLLVAAIRARGGNRDILGLSLSGGLDSRGILAGLGGEAEGIHTYTLGLSGCADERLAERMADLAGTRHEFVVLDQRYLQDFEQMATSMVRMSDGMFHPHESTEMLALEYFKGADFRILLRGHGGEIAKAALAYPVMVSPAVDTFSTGRQILSWIYDRTNLVLQDIDPEKLFLPPFGGLVKEGPWDSLKETCGGASENLSPADVCLYYYIREDTRRQVIDSLQIFRTALEVRLPYLDEAFIEKLLKLPVSHRNRGEVHRKLIERCMPELVKVPDSNTGAPLDSGAVRLFLTDKFNSVMKRLSIKGFRHYTEYQEWHRMGFRKSSQDLIFSEKSRSRGIYDMDYLRNVFEMHMARKKDYGLLIGTVIGLELWFRNFVD